MDTIPVQQNKLQVELPGGTGDFYKVGDGNFASES